MAGTATAPTRIAANNPFFSVVIASSVHDAVGVKPIPRSEPRRDTPQAEVIGSPSERLIARVYRDLLFPYGLRRRHVIHLSAIDSHTATAFRSNRNRFSGSG